MGAQLPYQNVCCHLGLYPRTASEYVDCGVAVLRPRVNEKVGLGDDDYTTHPLRTEAMKRISQDLCSAVYSGGPEQFLQCLEIVQQLPIAVFQFEQEVPA